MLKLGTSDDFSSCFQDCLDSKSPPYKGTFKLWAYKDGDMRFHVHSCQLADVSGAHCQMRASSTSGWAFVPLTVQRCVDYSSPISSFQA